MHNIKIHENKAPIVVFPTYESFVDWKHTILGTNQPAPTSWEVHTHKTRYVNAGINIHVVNPYYKVDRIIEYAAGMTFAVRLFDTPIQHEDTGKRYVGWAIHNSAYTEV